MITTTFKSQAPSCANWVIAATLIAASTLLVAPRETCAQFNPSSFGQQSGPQRNPEQERPAYRPPVFEKRERGEPVVAVRIVGNNVLEDAKIRTHLQTREGRDFDPETVRADVRRLSATGMFRNVHTYRKAVDEGVEVTFEVFELPLIGHLKFVGNNGIKDKALRKEAELKVGEPLQRYRIEEARRKIHEYYLKKGFSEAQVEVQEGLNPNDKGVVIAIHEGQRQRIYQTKFVGNTIASDSRLRTQIESKPGILWMFKGQVDRAQIDEDVERLTAYYRSLGFFKARVGRELEFGESGKWLTVTFVIDEGPRYKIRQVSLVGNSTFTTESLAQRLQFKTGDYFDARRMNLDLNELRDTYGSQGYIHADIKADPRFLEEPGMIDLVYDIQEGEQYRVGKIVVNIEGENPHTKRNVVINRLSLAPNDIIDIREIRASERRLRSSQLFLSDPARGIAPTIAIQPPEYADVQQYADRSSTDPQPALNR
jgi:outer membrane protein insertion porin family